jgi:hypothetical protein
VLVDVFCDYTDAFLLQSPMEGYEIRIESPTGGATTLESLVCPPVTFVTLAAN